MADEPLDLKKIATPPSTYDDYKWADYIEILCLLNVDQEQSVEDIISRIQKRKDFGETEDLKYDPDLVSEEGLTVPEISDRKKEQIEGWFRHLEYRCNAFEVFYPFTLEKGGRVLRRHRRLTFKHKLYIFFLLSSNFSYLSSKKTELLLANCFEIISREALKSYMPPNAEVHIFGANPLKEGKYKKGSLAERIERLAEDTNEKANSDSIVKFSSRVGSGSGDRGLDIVGWVPMGDRSKGILIVFGQCTCTEKWVPKQHSSSFEAWRGMINFKAPPTNMAFIPFFFRNSDGDWHDDTEIHSSILIDRLRFIYLLQKKITSIKELPSFEIVDEAIKQSEPIF